MSVSPSDTPKPLTDAQARLESGRRLTNIMLRAMGGGVIAATFFGGFKLVQLIMENS